MPRPCVFLSAVCLVVQALAASAQAQPPDAILHGGKIATGHARFTDVEVVDDPPAPDGTASPVTSVAQENGMFAVNDARDGLVGTCAAQ